MSYNRNMQIIHNSDNCDIVIFVGKIIDNVQPQPGCNATILIRKGLIQDLRYDTRPEDLPKGAGSRVLTWPELTLLPAMLDCHVHLALDGQDFQAAQQRWQDEQVWAEQVQSALTAALACGIGVLRDGGDKVNIGLRAKRLLEAGLLEGPRLLCCGQAIGKQGRYGSFLGPGVTTTAEACQLLDKLREQGVDWVKILVSGIVSFKAYGRVGEVQFSQAELNYIVKYAHALGLPVMAHASSDEAVSMAVKAQVDSVEHGYFISSQSLKTMAEREVPWVPTVVPVANQTRSPANRVHSEESLDVITRTYELQLRKVQEAVTLGVTLGVGTDAGAFGVLHGYGFLRELKLFSEAGLPTEDIIKAATLNAARICGVEGEYGTVQVSKKACLLAVEGNPYEDVDALTRGKFLIY